MLGCMDAEKVFDRKSTSGVVTLISLLGEVQWIHGPRLELMAIMSDFGWLGNGSLKRLSQFGFEDGGGSQSGSRGRERRARRKVVSRVEHCERDVGCEQKIQQTSYARGACDHCFNRDWYP